MEMHQVRYFLAVADQLNFTRAAETLHVTQPSLTRAIQKLEDELGGPLFARERANTHLTELGRIMHPHLSASLAAAEIAKRQALSFRKREVGQLNIGACSTVHAQSAAPQLIAVAQAMPALDLHIDVRPGGAIEKSLLAGEFDAALLAPARASHERFDEQLVLADPFVVACASDHRFQAKDEVTLEALDGEPLLVRLTCAYEDALAAAMEARGLQQVVRHRSSDHGWLIELARAGLGCMVVPQGLARAEDLPHRLLADLPFHHRIVLVTVAGRRHSPALTALLRRLGRPS